MGHITAYAQRSATAKTIVKLEALLTQFQGLLLGQSNPSTSIASPRSHSATNQIAVLLKCLRENVNGLEHHAQTASLVFHRSQIVYEAIHKLWTEASQDSTKFDTYTMAIARLEK